MDDKKIEDEKVEDEKVEETKEEAEVAEAIEKAISKSVKSIEANVKGEVKAFMEKQAELSEKKAGMYNPEIKADRKLLNEQCRKLIKTVLCKEMSTDVQGSPYAGYTVTFELSAEIRHLITNYGIARQEMLAIQLSKNSYKANDLVTDLSVFWVDEGDVIGSTQTVLGQSELVLNKLATIVSMTDELLEDEEIDLASFLTERVAEGFAKQEDLAFFAGDGTTPFGSFTGLLNNSSLNKVTLAGTTIEGLTADDLLDMVDATPQGALANGKFYMHRSILSIVRKLKASDSGVYIYQAPSAGNVQTIWNYPVVLVEAMPSVADDADNTGFVLFGDMKKACILGYKGAINVKQFDAGVIRNIDDNADINLITTDRQAIRWVERVGYIAILPKAMTRLLTKTSSI
jgi:HK97 family phage major capsid protein